jgi:hypothetical protein
MKPQSLSPSISGLKASVTTKINKPGETKVAPVWHRNYYEHVIRIIKGEIILN